jgi:biofilm PGA synthesis N-glycosyltransferase PgaC
MRRYLSVNRKYLLVLAAATSWLVVSVYLSLPWLRDLSLQIGQVAATFLIVFIALLPGFMNAFVVAAMLLDHRPERRHLSHYPSVSVLVPAYNEETSIRETLQSLLLQDYDGEVELIVINDGSSDQTVSEVRQIERQDPRLRLIDLAHNGGKSAALNEGLALSQHELVISVDADCWIRTDGVRHLVERLLSDPDNTAAVAGCILIRNSRENWLTRAQEWDYFLGIAAIKRIQSLFQGTLVAQGAFSIYRKVALIQVGGWPKTVGEDIVLTWRLLAKGYRIGHSSDACAFTVCPNTLSGFVRQRQRWSRGLIEAFKDSPRLIFKSRMSTVFVLWNLLFPLMDIAYTFGFVPGLVLALFGKFWIVGPMTLALIPPALLFNRVMYLAETRMFEREHLVIRKNYSGFFTYTLVYSLILQPACVVGYCLEILNVRKTWGTK